MELVGILCFLLLWVSLCRKQVVRLRKRLVIHRQFKEVQNWRYIKPPYSLMDERSSNELKKRRDGTSRTTITPTVAIIFLPICFRIHFVVKFQIIHSWFSEFSFVWAQFSGHILGNTNRRKNPRRDESQEKNHIHEHGFSVSFLSVGKSDYFRK